VVLSKFKFTLNSPVIAVQQLKRSLMLCVLSVYLGMAWELLN